MPSFGMVVCGPALTFIADRARGCDLFPVVGSVCTAFVTYGFAHPCESSSNLFSWQWLLRR